MDIKDTRIDEIKFEKSRHENQLYTYCTVHMYNVVFAFFFKSTRPETK